MIFETGYVKHKKDYYPPKSNQVGERERGPLRHSPTIAVLWSRPFHLAGSRATEVDVGPIENYRQMKGDGVVRKQLGRWADEGRGCDSNC